MRLRARDGVTNEWHLLERPCGACKSFDSTGLAMIIIYPGEKSEKERVEKKP